MQANKKVVFLYKHPQQACPCIEQPKYIISKGYNVSYVSKIHSSFIKKSVCEATMCWIMTERQFEREGMHVIRLLTCNRGLFKQFVRQYRSGPPLEFPLASSNHSIRTMCGMYKGQGRSRSKLETFLFTIIFSLACRLFSLYYCT